MIIAGFLLLIDQIFFFFFSGERDPAPLFFNSNVQQLLKKLTRVDLRTVFRTKRYGTPLKAPEYKFMTTEEIDMVIN
jgi:hypothetical protein